MARDRRKKGGDDADAGRWLATYGDLVTLLMAFFVMLYAMSSVDVQKFAAFVEGLAVPFGNNSAEGMMPESSGLLPDNNGLDEMQRANEEIRRLTGRGAAGYRSPAWDISDRTVDLLLQHGFLYESSMMGNDHCPYYVRKGDVISTTEPPVFGEKTSLIEMPISWSLDDFPHFEFLRTPGYVLPGLTGGDQVLSNWTADFDFMAQTEDWGVLTYTFHPYVTGRGHRMLVLEKLIQHLVNKNAVFMTMEQAALEFSQKVKAEELTPYP